MTGNQESDLERRKQVKVKVREDLKISTQHFKGRTHGVVKDPVGLRYFWFTEGELFLLKKMDGKSTLEESRQAFEARFRPDRLLLEEVESFGQQLLSAGLAFHESPHLGQQLYQRFRKRRGKERFYAWTNILYIRGPFFDPDRLLSALLPWGRWLFSRATFLAGLGMMLAAVLFLTTHFKAFLTRLPVAEEFFRLKTFLLMWLVLAGVKVLHEIGHGLACKTFGGEVHEMGLLFLCLAPCLYCNVSDAWMLSSKRRRLLISFAGIYVELLVAAFATFGWWTSTDHTFWNNLSLYLMLVCSISTVIFNGNPLLQYDGYYLLLDWLEIPNLRDRANRFLKHLVMKYCLGIEVPDEPTMADERGHLFVIYAVSSWVYRWVVTFGVLWFFCRFLKPYRLGAIGGYIAAMVVLSLGGWPLYQLGKNLAKRGRLPDMNFRRLLVSCGIGAAMLAGFFLVPLPVSRIRQAGLVQVRPEGQESIFVPVPGILERLYVHNGEKVVKNDIIAEFSSLDLENRLAEARSESEIRKVQLRGLREQARETADPEDRTKVQVTIAETEGESQHFAEEIQSYTKAQQRLTLQSPRSGVVMGLPHPDELGKFWDKGQESSFCRIGDPGRLRALVPLSPADYRLLKEDLEDSRKKGTYLPITLRVQGLQGMTWQGKVADLPEAEAAEVPFALTLPGGGPLAVRPGSLPNTYEPLIQQYLVGIELEGNKSIICPGTLATVAVDCRWRSAAWWFWRVLSTTFDLGLV